MDASFSLFISLYSANTASGQFGGSRNAKLAGSDERGLYLEATLLLLGCVMQQNLITSLAIKRASILKCY